MGRVDSMTKTEGYSRSPSALYSSPAFRNIMYIDKDQSVYNSWPTSGFNQYISRLEDVCQSVSMAHASKDYQAVRIEFSHQHQPVKVRFIVHMSQYLKWLQVEQSEISPDLKGHVDIGLFWCLSLSGCFWRRAPKNVGNLCYYNRRGGTWVPEYLQS